SIARPVRMILPRPLSCHLRVIAHRAVPHSYVSYSHGVVGVSVGVGAMVAVAVAVGAWVAVGFGLGGAVGLGVAVGNGVLSGPMMPCVGASVAGGRVGVATPD